MAGTAYTNTVTLSGSSLLDDKDGPTAPDNPNERVSTATDSSTVPIVGTGISKTVTPDRATIGEQATWRVSVVVPVDTSFYDASIIDQMPAGVSDIAITGYTCAVLTAPPTECTLTPVRLDDAPGPGGSTLIGWTFGDLAGLADQRIISVTYTGTVADVPGNVAGLALTNTATSKWNLTPNGPNDDPDSADSAFDTTGSSASATVTVIEPSVTIDKLVDYPTPGPADRFNYTITAHNASGPNVSASYNGVLVDTVPVGVVVDPSSITFGGVLTGDDPVRGGGTITWDTRGLNIGYPPGGSRDRELLGDARPVDDPDHGAPAATRSR